MSWANRRLEYREWGLTLLVAGHLSVHAVRRSAPQAGHAHLQGQIAEYGQMGQRAS
jgi:hypothetical protein